MSFFTLQDLGLLSSSDSILADWLAAMQTQYPGYLPAAGNLEYIQAQIFSIQLAALAQLASSGATELFRTYGTTLLGVAYQQGVAAQAVVVISAQAAGQLTTLSGTLGTGTPIVTLPVVQLQNDIAAGSISVTDGGIHTDVFTTTGATAGSTAIPISSQTPSFAYLSGSPVNGVSAYSLPAFTQFSLDSLGFYNLTPATINSGTSQQVTLTAVQNGVAFNGAGSGGAVSAVQQTTWINTLTVLVPAANGLDPEDDSHYLDRLAVRTQLMAPRPITADDFASIALDFTPAPATNQELVGRATAVDGYDANPLSGTFGTFNNGRMVTVAVTDANGLALNSDTMYGYSSGTFAAPVTTAPSAASGWGVMGWLRALRELNFLVYVVSPTYSPIYVTVTVKAADGWDSTTIKTNVQTALLNYLSPSTWGLPPSNSLGWQNATTVFYSSLTAAVQSASGVDHVAGGTLAIGFSATPGVYGDLTLPGPVALPTSNSTTIPTSAITVT